MLLSSLYESHDCMIQSLNDWQFIQLYLNLEISLILGTKVMCRCFSCVCVWERNLIVVLLLDSNWVNISYQVGSSPSLKQKKKKKIHLEIKKNKNLKLSNVLKCNIFNIVLFLLHCCWWINVLDSDSHAVKTNFQIKTVDRYCWNFGKSVNSVYNYFWLIQIHIQ